MSAAWRVACADAGATLAALPAMGADLIVLDPPYHRVLRGAAWDRRWPSVPAYLAWLDTVLAAAQRALAPQGSLYCFAGPALAARVAALIEGRFRLLNQIRWTKAEGWHRKRAVGEMRRLQSPWEAIGYAAHASRDDLGGEGASPERLAFADSRFPHEALRAYLDGERRAPGPERPPPGGAERDVFAHFWTRCQWQLPTAAQYERLRRAYPGRFLRPHADLVAEHARGVRPFRPEHALARDDTWPCPPLPAGPGKHPAAKPPRLAMALVAMASRPGDLVVDPFCGSGVFALAALALGRRVVAGDEDARWAAATEAACADKGGAGAVPPPVECEDGRRTRQEDGRHGR